MDLMDFPPPRRKKRTTFGVNITPLIDVFSIIVIFLVKGTVFSQASAEVYADVKVPMSRSKESLDESMKVVLVKEKIVFPEWNEEYPLELATTENAHDPLRLKLDSRIKRHFDDLKGRAGHLTPSVQLIAGRDRGYDVIYAVSEMLQLAGASQVIFMTEGW